MADDFDLLRMWQGGDEDAGNTLVRRHFGSVYGFFRNKVDRAADDLTQATFLGCVENLSAYRGEASFRGYLFGIARNQLLRHFSDRHRARVVDMSEVSLHELSGSPSGAVAVAQEQQLLAQALRLLPIDLQITVELYYCEELPVADVAAALEIPAGTVKSRLSRARELLRDAMEKIAASPALRTSTIQDLEGWARRLRQVPDEAPK